MSVEEFIKQYTPHANRVAVSLNVPALVTLAQAAWESGWGKHAPQYNFFGMTAGAGYTGKTQTLTTYEYKNGVKVQVKRKFRAYDSATEAFADYAKNLASHENYVDAFNYKMNPEMFLKKICDGGYATDPNYYKNVLKIMNMIKKYVI